MVQCIVAFPKIEDARGIRRLLVQQGFCVAAVCVTGAQVLSQANSLVDGIVVCGYRLPDMLYNELYHCLPHHFDMLLIVSRAYLSEGVEAGVVRLPMPLKTHELLRTLGWMSEALLKKRKKWKLQKKKRDPAEKQVIEAAKRLLMQRNRMTEEEAHRYIQKCSMDSGTSMPEMAQMVIDIMS